MTGKDIGDINSLLSLGASEYLDEKTLDKQSLIQDIEKYKTIKQCLSHLEAQKRDLEKRDIHYKERDIKH